MTTVYHGSISRFEKFSYDCIGKNGTSEGIGFYFTDNLDIARGYAWKESDKGYIYTVEFKGKKSLNPDKLTLTRGQVKRLVNAIGRLYLDNIGEVEYEGYTSVLNRAVNDLMDYNESDVDLICAIVNGINNHESVFNLLYDVLGYDSIIIKNPSWGSHTIYIALIHSAYEIINISEYESTND